MANIIVGVAKYMMILLIALYSYHCFAIFAYEDDSMKKRVLHNQRVLMFMIHFMAFAGMYFKTDENKILIFYLAQVLLLAATIWCYGKFYPKVSKLIVNNMCMLLSIGFIMITRLSYNKAVKQCIIVAGAMIISFLVPIIIRKMKCLSDLKMLYALIGIVALGAVVVIGRVSGGAKLGFEIAGFGIQPSEFVKILFVFYVASNLKKSTAFKDVVMTTIVAAFHVLILVVSKDLGAALIIFVVYLVMLYVATKQPLYTIAGLAAGSVAAVAAYHLFNHVRVRVLVWQDPFAVYDRGGYQVAQSLFAIGTGSWFGTGLFQGKADAIPVADEDFIFSAISEEMGLIFALCLVLICVSCYIMFLNIAMQLRNRFYKYVALGLGTSYIFQAFLNIGGVTKFIPSTGVTLPLVSYGGSSIMSTLIMFAIIQGLYILKEEEEEEIERKRRQKEAREQKERRDRHHIAQSGRRETSPQRPVKDTKTQGTRRTQAKENRQQRTH